MSRFSREISALITLALPVSLTQLALVGMTATDVLIAGRAGPVELAGMNLGANSWHLVILFFVGVGLATQPLVAKQFGAQNNPAVKHQLHQSLWLCFFLGIVASFVTLLASRLLLKLDFEPAMLKVASGYLLIIGSCALPMTMIAALRSTLEGLNQTRPVLWIHLLAFSLNIPLDYVLVNGVGFFPRLGGVGCAWATAFLTWMMCLAMFLVLLRHKALRHRALLRQFERPNRKSIIRTWKLGFPIGISIVIELSMFSGAGILIASFGSIPASAHAVAITIVSMSFMVYMGLGQGITIRASHFLGAGQGAAAQYTIKAGTIFNLAVALFLGTCFLIFHEAVVRAFTRDAEVVALAVVLLFFGAVFQLADCLQVSMVCALRAYHDTASPPLYQFIAFWVLGLPLGIGLAFYDWWPPLSGAAGLWCVMVVSLSLVSLLLLNRLRSIMKQSGSLSQVSPG